MSQRLAFELMGDLSADLTGVERPPSSHSGSVMNSSADLIARARNGDQEAFRLIFDRYARPVLSFIYDLVGQRDLAEELAQETFVRAFKNLKQIRDDTKLSSWLFGISRNVALEAVRSRQKDYRNHDAAACLEIIEATQLNPDQDLLQKELNGAMNRALHSMNDEWRTIFVLKVLHQRSYQEIVEITGFSLAKVKTDLHRARLEMRRRMGPLL
jgi:RNA polymerase sigma-70 factor, ECF subfamily